MEGKITENIESVPQIKICDAKPEDSEAIQDVVYKTWLETYPNQEFGVTRDDIEARFQNLEERIEKRKVLLENLPLGDKILVAKDGAKIVGVYRGTQNEEDNKVSQFYVLPEYQGRGVGRSLWLEGEESLDKTKDTFLTVAPYNKTAVAFYQKNGFEDTGEQIMKEGMRMKSTGKIVPLMLMCRKALQKE